MRRNFINLLLGFFFLFLYSGVKASDTIVFNSFRNINIGNKIDILEDKQGSLTPFQVLKSKNFKRSNQEVPNMQISTSAFWGRFSVKNLSDKNKLVLELLYPTIDSVSFYSLNPDSSYTVEQTGEFVPIQNREYNHQNYIFDLFIPKGETRSYLIRIKGSEQMQLPLTLGTTKSIYESLLNKDIIFGIYAGIILVMGLYNLFIFFVVRDRVYILYVLYIFLVGLTQACIQGYAFKFLWPNSEYWANQSIIIAPDLTGIAALEFIKNFLNLKQFSKPLYKGIFIFTAIYIIALILGFLDQYHLSQNLIQLTAMTASIYVWYVGYRISKKGYRPAFFFLVAWSIFLTSVVIFVLKNFNILPYNDFTFYALQIGSALEVILLSFALADKINILKKEKEESQAQALYESQKNQRLIKEQNIILDARVQERTVALKKANDELNSTLNNLRETQSQLVNSEKMVSLGQLTAGVAHEINNPINFVSSSIKPLKRDISDILAILAQYEEVNETNLLPKKQEIDKFKDEIDLDYVKEEIDLLLKGIGEGASRTAEIVKGLRNFSRMDENDLKKANIHEGIDSTLVLLNHKLSSIGIVKNYGDIPEIECYAGKLNQVFMNIINNAIHAIEASKKNEQGKITITTSASDKNITISIKDTGTGMPENLREKIFEPFFTTKDVGEGTGLGLSIAYTIIKNHKGDIKVKSEPGVGTEFIITLPNKQVSNEFD